MKGIYIAESVFESLFLKLLRINFLNDMILNNRWLNLVYKAEIK